MITLLGHQNRLNLSLSSTSLFCKMFTHSPPLLTAHSCVPRVRFYSSNSMHSHRASFKCDNGSISIRNAQAMVVVACADKDLTPREERTPLETVLKLNEAIKEKNISELSDVIAEECWCVSNLFSAFRPFLGKKQVLAFFSSLMKALGNNIEFVVQQTSDDGMVIGVSWKLEWNQVPIPLGNGFSFYMCHVYQGKVMIKNVEIFLEPILHIEPLVIYLVMAAMEKLNIQARSTNKSRRAIFILVVFLLAAIIGFLLK